MGVVELYRLHSGRACRTRNLANAFLGETTLLLKAVEAYEEIDRLKAAAEGKLGRLEDFQVFAPPKFVVYEIVSATVVCSLRRCSTRSFFSIPSYNVLPII